MKCIVEQKERICSYDGPDHLSRKNSGFLCDYVFDPRINMTDIPTNGTYIVWCKSDPQFLRKLFNICERNKSHSKYIIISSESDFGHDENIINAIPDNVIKLYGQNILYRSPKVESIPIGSASITWIGDDEEYCFAKESEQYKLIKETLEPKKFTNLALLDFNIGNNRGSREFVYNHFKDYSWVTVKPCNLSLSEYRQTEYYNDFERYYRDIYNHKFIFSPLGNGVDCGRTWQALYLGTIPIVPSHVNIQYYQDLPILIYDDINTITSEYLNTKWDEITKKISDGFYNMEKLKISYWVKKIKDEKNEYSR